ncbi:unnamed protein product [Oikopleura dioica]|uniref:Uncharacterized protein n=1 Tax=Oikopleura dioica TaxID=34765 RepID=E4XEM5_OIKDI|nr:unnamed protein product [Oikopleura dioica]
MEINDNDDFEEKKRLSTVSLCSDNFRIVNGKIPSTLVAIQTIALMLLVAAVALTVAILIIPFWKVAQINSEKSISIGLFSICTSTNESTTIAFWNNDLTWKLEIRDEPSYIFFSRTFLLFSLVIGLFGTFLSIVGSGMVCCKVRCTCLVQFFASLFIVAAGVLSGLTGCLFPIMFKDPVENSQQDQIDFILSREKYFEIDFRVRTTFRNGICLFACWGVMALYAIGSSLYIFSAFLVCSPNLKPKKMRYTSVQTTEEEKMITKIHSRTNLVEQELQSQNNLELRHQIVKVESQNNALLAIKRHGAHELTSGPPQQQRNKMPRAYSPVYPEYVEEIKPTQENTSSILNPTSINRANFDTSSIPSRSQVI